MTLLQFEIFIFVLFVAYCLWQYFYEGYFYRLCEEEMRFTKFLFFVTRCFIDDEGVEGKRYRLEFLPDVLVPKRFLIDIEVQFDGFCEKGIIVLAEDGDSFIPSFDRDKLKKQMYEIMEAAATRLCAYQEENVIAQFVLREKYNTLLEKYNNFEKRYREVCRVEPGSNFRMIWGKDEERG